MKSVRIAGLCLAAMFVMSMVAAGTASAAPHWLVCSEGGSATKYSEHQCTGASGTGKWQWNELTTTEAVRTQGTLTLITSGVPIVGTVEIKCSGTDEGFVGPGGKSKTTVVTTTKCEKGKNCEEILGSGKAEARNLPWSSEGLETENKIHGTITNGKTGTEAPGWKASCKVLGVSEENICTSTQGLVVLENKNSPGAEAALLVLADFIEPNKPKAACTVKGTEGEVRGSILTLLSNGWGLRITK